MKQWPLGLLRHARSSFKPSPLSLFTWRAPRWSGDARPYGAAAAGRPPTVDSRDWLQLSILTDASNNLDPNAVLSQVPSLSPEILRSKGGSSTILLITKSFATLATDHSNFQQYVIEKLWNDPVSDESDADANDQRQVRLVTAVVDELPSARQVSQPSDGPSLDSSRGRQGVAILASSKLPLLGPSTSKPNKESTGRTDSIGSEIPDVISFNLFSSHDPARPSPRPILSLALPVASTVFETGTPSTLSDSTWAIGKQGSQKLSGQTQLASDVQVNLPVSSSVPSENTQDSLHPSKVAIRYSVPLIRLCAPRKVCASNGNVVTRVSAIGPNAEPIPASQELESAVFDYLNSRGQGPGLVSVWALILPHERFIESEVSEMGVDVIKDVGNLLGKGARIHRVLSGGGGWGQKAGLLSLDPETSHTKDVESPSLDVGSDMFSTLFKTVAKPGDFIAFLAATEGGASETLPGSEVISKRCTFGVLPSTDSGNFGPTESHMGLETVVTGEFGMLSEGGLSVCEHGPDFRSRLDVPYTRVYV